MATPTKAAGTVVLAHTDETHPVTVVGPDQGVSTAFRASIFLDHALVEATANTDAGSWRVQVSAAASGDEEWVTLQEIPIIETGTPATEPMTATEAIGVTSLAVASTTGFAAGDVIYIQDTSVVAASEWSKIQEIDPNVSIEILDGLTTGKDSSDVIWGSAQRNIVTVNLESFVRLRVVYMTEGTTGGDVEIRATMTVLDSIG